MKLNAKINLNWEKSEDKKTTTHNCIIFSPLYLQKHAIVKKQDACVYVSLRNEWARDGLSAQNIKGFNLR